MKVPVAWIACFLMLLFCVWTLFNSGFSDEDLQHQTELMKAKAINECNSHRMSSAGVYPRTYDSWVALCCTESPFRVYEFVVEDV